MNELLKQKLLETKPVWDTGWTPFTSWNYNRTMSFELQGTQTHCGTTELKNLHKKGVSLKEISKHIGYSITKQNTGTFLYYAPHMGKYKKAVEKFKSLGAQPLLLNARHLGFVKRRPDKGYYDIWYLSISPEEVKELLEWQLPSPPAPSVQAQMGS